MNRREFLIFITGLAVVLSKGGQWLGKTFLPRRCLRAQPTKAYPGKVLPLKDDDISHPAAWSG
jgi:hypothetical protein